MGREQFLLMVPVWPPETQYLVKSAFDAKNLEESRPPLPGESAAIPAVRREKQARVIHGDGPRSTSCVPVAIPLFQRDSLAANRQDPQGLFGLPSREAVWTPVFRSVSERADVLVGGVVAAVVFRLFEPQGSGFICLPSFPASMFPRGYARIPRFSGISAALCLSGRKGRQRSQSASGDPPPVNSAPAMGPSISPIRAGPGGKSQWPPVSGAGGKRTDRGLSRLPGS